MSLDLNKLSNKLDEALIKETTETLNKFLNDKRMKNETNKITLTSTTNTTATTASTTSTTFLCTQFIAEDRITTSLPNCIRCGKPQYQHPLISNTL